MNYILQEDNSSADLPAGVVMAITGRAGTADQSNANKRVYPAGVYRKVVRAFNSRPAKEEMLGELDHPSYMPRLSATAMRVTGLNMKDGQHLDFKAHVLDTPAGKTLESLIRARVNVNISTRGSGSQLPCCEAHAPEVVYWYEKGGKTAGMAGEHEACTVIQDDYVLEGIDAVARGAAASAVINQENQYSPPGKVGESEENKPMDQLREEHPPAGSEENKNAPLAARVAQLETQLQQASQDLQILTAASQAERETLQAALSTAEGQVASLTAAQESAQAAHEQALAEAVDARDLAVSQLNKGRVEEQTNALLVSLRPDVRKKVAEQLAACQTPEEVTERWKAIEQVLSAAGITTVPAGSGRPDNGETPRHAAAPLSPEQRMQRQLLGYGA